MSRVFIPLAFGTLMGALCLTLWYGFLSSFILPQTYRPLHHWMYGLILTFLGVWRSGRFHGRFLLAAGLILLCDDLHDLLEAFSLLGL